MASKPPAGPFIIYVTFEPREDGGLRAYSDQVPGFVLSHKNPELVEADVEPALTVILSAMYDRPISVQKAKELGCEEPDVPAAHICAERAKYVGLDRLH